MTGCWYTRTTWSRWFNLLPTRLRELFTLRRKRQIIFEFHIPKFQLLRIYFGSRDERSRGESVWKSRWPGADSSSPWMRGRREGRFEQDDHEHQRCQKVNICIILDFLTLPLKYYFFEFWSFSKGKARIRLNDVVLTLYSVTLSPPLSLSSLRLSPLVSFWLKSRSDLFFGGVVLCSRENSSDLKSEEVAERMGRDERTEKQGDGNRLV